MFKDQLAKIAATPKTVFQKATTAVTKTADDVKTNITTKVKTTVHNVLEAGEAAAWKVADKLHDAQRATN